MKKILLLVLFIVSLSAKGQTNVSGGIYSNTTWTKANSPYIVTDTVVVFPHVTLTIQPGVTVKFYDHKYLEIRDGILISDGTLTDSITFTSNSVSPTRGIWGGIRFVNTSLGSSFNFINVEYATSGIYNQYLTSYIKNSNFTNNNFGINSASSTLIDSCNFKFNWTGINYIISSSVNFCNISNSFIGIGTSFNGIFKNCTIDSNQTGVGSQGTFINCTINFNQNGLISKNSSNTTLKNCIINHNSILGLHLEGSTPMTDSVINCEIKYNGIGFIIGACGVNGQPGLVTQCIIESNTTGIQVRSCSDIYCNRFCNNTTYDLENLANTPLHVPNNYWCTTDSATIGAHIYDGYDNLSRGLVYFMPFDSTCSPLTSINEPPGSQTVDIYPNPLTTSSILQLNTQIKNAEVVIYDMLGKEMVRKRMNGDRMELEKGSLESGVYFVRVRSEERQWVGKIIVQ